MGEVAVKPVTQVAVPPAAAPVTTKDRAKRFGEIAPAVRVALDSLKTGAPVPPVVLEARGLLPTPKRDALALYEFSNNVFRLHVAGEIDPRLLGESDFFHMFGDQLNPFDTIRCIASDRSWCADFVVLDCNERMVDAAMTTYVRARTRIQDDTPGWCPEGYEIIRLGAETATPGWAIKRADGLLMMNSGMPFKDHEAARRALKDHAVFKKPDQVQYFP